MALSKSLSTKFGVPATYHNIGVARWVKESQSIVLEVNSYASAAARQAGDSPLQVQDFTFEEQANSLDLEDAYELLKSTDGLNGATDA